MTAKTPSPESWMFNGLDDPFEFQFTMKGMNYDEFSIEVYASRAPETIPCIVEMLRTLATRIERGNLELPPVTRF
jgi:hypothetical protein